MDSRQFEYRMSSKWGELSQHCVLAAINKDKDTKQRSSVMTDGITSSKCCAKNKGNAQNISVTMVNLLESGRG